MRKKKENKVKPSLEEKKSIDLKTEIKKSIVKAHNKTVLENPCSFSIAKNHSEEIIHQTFHFREENENDSLKLNI